MGLFNLFKKPIIFQDDVFGELRYMGSKDGFFEGEGFFSPTKIKTGYTIDGDLSGPTYNQKQFYKEVQ